MSMPGEILRRLQMLLHRGRFQDDLEEEMQLHLDLRQQQHIAAGSAPDTARFAAQRKFGNATRLKEKSHTAWGWEWMESFAQDIAYGARAMLRSPGVTHDRAALAGPRYWGQHGYLQPDGRGHAALPAGQGSAAARPSRRRKAVRHRLGFRRTLSFTPTLSSANCGRKTHVFSDTAAIFSMTNAVHGFVVGRTDAEPMNVQLVSGTYFSTLGVPAAMGRVLD